MKRSLNYGVVNTADNYAFDDNFHTKRYVSQSPPKRHDNSMNEVDEDSFDGAHVMQMEKDTFKLRRDLQDAIASKKQAESRILAYVWLKWLPVTNFHQWISFSLPLRHPSIMLLLLFRVYRL